MTIRAELDNMRERINAATEGPWEMIGGGEYVTGASILVAPDDGGVNGAGAEFIAHARTDVERLLSAVTNALAEADESAPVWFSSEQEYGYDTAMDAVRDAITEALEEK